MKIKLVFQDWFKNGEQIRNPDERAELGSNIFHSGTIFDGEIFLNGYEEIKLTKALASSNNPVFYIIKND